MSATGLQQCVDPSTLPSDQQVQMGWKVVDVKVLQAGKLESKPSSSDDDKAAAEAAAAKAKVAAEAAAKAAEESAKKAAADKAQDNGRSGLLSDDDQGEQVAEGGVLKNASEAGTAWPPMAAFVPDGKGGTFVVSDGRDWRAGGLIRNGTFNKVSEKDCVRQCELLPECRLALWVRTNGECWLDSEVSVEVKPCPLVDFKRNCASYVKKVVVGDTEWPYGKASTNLSDWDIGDQENWDATNQETQEQGGKLGRNGRFNSVDSDRECQQQCAELNYCRVAVFHRGTGECWHSSKPKKSAGKCAMRGGKRDCISFIKLRTDRNEKPGSDAVKVNPGRSEIERRRRRYRNSNTDSRDSSGSGANSNSATAVNNGKNKQITFTINVPNKSLNN